MAKPMPTATAKSDIGQALGEEIRPSHGDEIMVSDLTYDLRSGDPTPSTSSSPSPSPTLPSICSATASPAVWSACKTAATRTLHYPRPPWALAKWTSHPLQHRALSPNYTSKLGAPLLFNRI